MSKIQSELFKPNRKFNTGFVPATTQKQLHTRTMVTKQLRISLVLTVHTINCYQLPNTDLIVEMTMNIVLQLRFHVILA